MLQYYDSVIILEPAQGSGFAAIPPDEFIIELRRICDEHEILMLADEIYVGFGRTGKWFAYQHYDVTPDIMTMARDLRDASAGRLRSKWQRYGRGSCPHR